MKTIKIIFSSLLLFFLALNVNAQDITKTKSKVSSKVLLENDNVRVLEIESPVGESTPVHSHQAYIAYPLTDGKLEETINGKTKTNEFKAGEPKYMDAVTHVAKNVGTAPMKMIIVELKNASAKPTK